ncbi:large ribosomal subunit protein mL55 [Hemitrygon akajei]|uniref:large ribosomal subunit protein mL55 n=1 Tax=Hemitrygon akajei TaxID=2704970 RepID=UPI003BF9EC80
MAAPWSARLRWFAPFLQLNASERLLPATCPWQNLPKRNNSNRTSVVRVGRQVYTRLYPVLLVQPDGSTINIRYKEPKRIITMPVDVSLLSEAERKARMHKRRPKKVKVKEEQLEDEFKVENYSKFWKKK